MLSRFLFASVAAIGAASLALAQEPEVPSTETAVQSAPATPPLDDGAHGSETSPAVAPVDELDELSQGAEEPFPDIEETPQRRPVSVTVRALDKITARYRDLTANIGEPVKFGSLEITARYCDKRPPEEFPETTAFLEVFDRDLSRARSAALVEVREPPARAKDRAAPASAATPTTSTGSDLPSALDPDRIFAGWMFESSPALNSLEHPVYDVWVIDCKTAAIDN